MATSGVIAAFERLLNDANEYGKDLSWTVEPLNVEQFEKRKDLAIKQYGEMKNFMTEQLNLVLFSLANSLRLEIVKEPQKSEYTIKCEIFVSTEDYESVNEDDLKTEVLDILKALTQHIPALQLHVTKTGESCALNRMPILEFVLEASFN